MRLGVGEGRFRGLPAGNRRTGKQIEGRDHHATLLLWMAGAHKNKSMGALMRRLFCLKPNLRS